MDFETQYAFRDLLHTLNQYDNNLKHLNKSWPISCFLTECVIWFWLNYIAFYSNVFKCNSKKTSFIRIHVGNKVPLNRHILYCTMQNVQNLLPLATLRTNTRIVTLKHSLNMLSYFRLWSPSRHSEWQRWPIWRHDVSVYRALLVRYRLFHGGE